MVETHAAPTCDLLVVGSGPVGCVIAERAASQLGWHCLVVEKRRHIAGLCYDEPHDGILVHRYGPHLFRTDNPAVIEYLSRFTGWIEGRYFVQAAVRGELYPFPINRLTLEKFFRRRLDADGARRLLDELRDRTITEPANSEELALSRVGRELYETFFLGYTLKQWERHPRELDPSVIGRIPVRYDDDCRYVTQKFQQMPAAGFTAMFRRMLDHPRIELRLGTDYSEIRGAVVPARATVYTGPVDEYFGFSLGRLPWRSLEFQFDTFDREYAQPSAVINYPTDHDYTRTVEFKHLTGQRSPRTVVSREYPRREGEPFYPVPAPESRALYARYLELAENERRTRGVHFAGRLARYTYINTDQAVEMALALFEEIRPR